MAAYGGLADLVIISNAGVPTDGTSGTGAGVAQPGSLCIDTTNFDIYMNTGTQASPTWTKKVD
jgi:hypothetical protein